MGTLRFTISGRGKPNDQPVLTYLAKKFPAIPIANIDSVFGFVEKSTLYGGRPFWEPELTEEDIASLYDVGIGVRIPFTNHYAEPEEFQATLPIFEKYHRAGNAVIVTNDDLAEWIRAAFPRYRIEASVIKNIHKIDQVHKALDLYDTVVLPMEMNEDEAFLKEVPQKDRITLFANAGCALTCPSHTCYPTISKFNKDGKTEMICSQPLKARENKGIIDFDLNRLQDLGFSRFKVLRPSASFAGVNYGRVTRNAEIYAPMNYGFASGFAQVAAKPKTPEKV